MKQVTARTPLQSENGSAEPFSDSFSPGEAFWREPLRDLRNFIGGNGVERNQRLNANARALRKHMTKEEARLWYQFLCRYPLRFRRQYVIGNYITDFYCHQAKLVVELDGSQHYTPEEMEYDKKRTGYLEALGLLVLRFSNLDVLRRFPGVCEAIDLKVKERAAADQPKHS